MKEKLIKNENSKKWFVVSDIHSFYTPFINSLKRAGFQKTNPNHTLVIAGDVFDRGKETIELFNYLKSIPEERLILVKGNHEELYEDLLMSYFPAQHDVSNGTLRTFCTQTKYPQEYMFRSFWKKQEKKDFGMETGAYEGKEYYYWQAIRNQVKESEITKFILDKERWLNYVEIGPYIIVHSRFPSVENWRNLDKNSSSWSSARWGSPIEFYLWHFNRPNLCKDGRDGRILVVGHWFAGDFFRKIDGIKKPGKKLNFYHTNNLVALDAGVDIKYLNKEKTSWELTHKQNVLIIDESFKAYDKNGNLIIDPIIR